MAAPRKATTEAIEAAARKYRVCSRTVRRWLEGGLAVRDLGDMEKVADHILRQRAPKTSTLQVLTK